MFDTLVDIISRLYADKPSMYMFGMILLYLYILSIEHVYMNGCCKNIPRKE